MFSVSKKVREKRRDGGQRKGEIKRGYIKGERTERGEEGKSNGEEQKTEGGWEEQAGCGGGRGGRRKGM